MTNDATLVDAALFPRLIVRARGRVVEEVDLRAELTIGRAEDNDLKLLDPKSSRHHALIKREGALFVVTDLGSANGTWVNGVRLTGPHTLRHGERITIGDAELTYQEPGKSVQDTVTSIGVPVAVRAAARPQPAAEPAAKGLSRGMIIGLALVAAVLILAVAAVAVYFLAPSVYESIGLVSTATPTALPVVEASATPAGAAMTPVAPPPTTEAPSPGGAVDPQEVNDLLTQAEALTRRSKFEEAIVIYQDLTSRVPDDARPEIGWAWALLFDDRADEALPHAKHAVELDPLSAEAMAVLARAHLANGDVDRALAMAQQAVEAKPGSAQAHAVLAEATMANGQIQQAVDEADLALVQDLNNAQAHRIRGWLYQVAENDMGRAAGELQIAAGLQPELWLRRHDLGLLLYEAEDYTTAILAFQDALGIRPKAITYTAIGKAYYALGQYDRAKASLQQALSAGAEDVDTYAWLAVALAQLDRCDEAETYYQQALVLDSSHPQAIAARDICQGEQSAATPTPTTTSSAGSGSAATPGSTPKATQQPAAVSGWIAFPVWDAAKSNYDTYVAQAKDGSGRSLVAEEMHQPALSPDGQWLAVNGEQPEHLNLFVVKRDGSSLKEISRHEEDALPWWSPNGKSLVFSSRMHGDKQSRVYIIDDVPLEGGRKEEGRPLNFGPDDIRGEYPTWTADGQIVYSGCDVTVEPAPCGLFVMLAAPGAHPFKQLTKEQTDTAPAAFGDRVAFTSNREGNWEIYLVNLDGSGLKRLTDNAALDGLPTWSPDGQTIAFVSNQGGAWAVWAMSPDGSNRRRLFEIGGSGLASDWQHERISWAP